MNKSQSGRWYRCGVVENVEGPPYPRIGAMALMLSLALGGVAATAFPATALAQTAMAEHSFSIPAGSLRDALDALASQGGITVLYSPELVTEKTTTGLSGRYVPTEALRQLLKDSGLQAQEAGDSTFTLRRAPAEQPKPKAVERSATVTAPEIQKLASMTVTGSRIRGGSTPSPVIAITATQIQEEGFTDLGEVIRSVSQNYNGGQNPGVSAGAWGGGYYNQNITGGSAANLRGLGQDATLTLLNGRRMSYGGYDQAVDISAIPVDAVERIEIVTDGASAIYGSDAVGGVVNVILKRDFEGVDVGARYGEATEGGLTTHEYTATAGTTWSTGGLIATGKKASNDPIYSDQRDYTNYTYDHTTLYQSSDLRSGLLSAHQSFGHSIELQLDALRTERSKESGYGYETSYLFYPTETTTSLVSPSVVFSLSNGWTLNVSAALGKDKTDFFAHQVIRETGETSLNRPFSYANKSRTYEVGAEGALFALPGGDARLAVGAGYRDNDFLYLYQQTTAADGDESSRFAYAELNLPLIASEQNVAGVNRLELTGAIRAEDHDSYGRVTTPKIGLIYSPTADFTVKTSWGKSFKAPTLYQRYIGGGVYLYPVTSLGGVGYAPDATALYVNGGNPDLSPERAKTWSASLALHPEALPSLEAELTWFSIDYNQRIVQPIINSAQAISSPIYDMFVDYYPTAEEQAEIISNAFEFANYTGGPYDPDMLVAVVDNRFVNASRQRVNGTDLSGSYRLDLAESRLTVRGSISWLDSEQALTSTSSFSNTAGTLFYPAKVVGRLGTVWNTGGFTASLFGNYKSGVKNTADDTKGGSFITFDTTLRYDTGGGDSIFADMGFEFSAQNLLNRDPPLYAVTSLSNVPYDSTNYSAIGRFVSLSVSKQW